jgi:hypothetical protein
MQYIAAEVETSCTSDSKTHLYRLTSLRCEKWNDTVDPGRILPTNKCTTRVTSYLALDEIVAIRPQAFPLLLIPLKLNESLLKAKIHFRHRSQL